MGRVAVGHPVELGVVGRREVDRRDPRSTVGVGGGERQVAVRLDEFARMRVEVLERLHAYLIVVGDIDIEGAVAPHELLLRVRGPGGQETASAVSTHR